MEQLVGQTQEIYIQLPITMIVMRRKTNQGNDGLMNFSVNQTTSAMLMFCIFVIEKVKTKLHLCVMSDNRTIKVQINYLQIMRRRNSKRSKSEQLK